ncbi:extracellular solute-binding protein [Lachnospiraceae bacterium]|nr:extracellular solute-binding protein [Lachnospiraceae bacterium]
MKIKKKFIIGAVFFFTAVILCLAVYSGYRRASSPAAPKQSLTYLVQFDNELSSVCNGDLNQTDFYRELEKRTNVHINFCTSPKDLQSFYQFGKSSRTSPDLLDQHMLYQFYGTSAEKCLTEGLTLDLTDLVKEYAPNYYRLIQRPEYHDIAYTSSGRIAAIYSLKTEEQKTFAGLQLRKDWLEELNLEVPVTYDDWENVLTAFKEKKNIVAPLYLPAAGFMQNDALNAGFGVSTGFFQKDGSVFFGPAEEGWHSYLKLLNRWYKKGLIDPNFITGQSIYAPSDVICTGAYGAWYGLYTMPSTLSFDTENAAVVAAAPPKQNANDILHLQHPVSYADNCIAISRECENPKLALQWIDYLFSEKGSLFASYGTKGKTYTLDKDNKPVFTDLILNNPDGLSFTQALKFYTFTPGFASACIDWKREQQAVPADDIAMCDVWSEGDCAYLLPENLQVSLEQRERLSEISNALNGIVYQYTAGFINGTIPFSEYKNYLKALDECGLDEAVSICQEGLKNVTSDP